MFQQRLRQFLRNYRMPSTLQINRLQKRNERGRRCPREMVMQQKMRLVNLVPKARLSCQIPPMAGRVKQRKSGHQKRRPERPRRRKRKDGKSVRHLLLILSLVLTVVVSRQCLRSQALEADRRKAGGYNLLCLSRERPRCQKLPKGYDKRWEREISGHLLQVCLGSSGMKDLFFPRVLIPELDAARQDTPFRAARNLLIRKTPCRSLHVSFAVEKAI